MFKVLIVDDESYVIKSLITTINWNLYGFEIIGQAENGIDALEQIRKLKPDIVFTDVKMPGMGGLELIKNVSEELGNVLFVVISGYAEFSYAQKAMKYGALGYCLKPFEESEIISILSKAKSILDINRTALEARLLEILDDKSKQGLEDTAKIFGLFGLEYGDSSEILVAVTIGTGKLVLPDHIKHINLKIGNNKNAFLLESKLKGPVNSLLGGSIQGQIKGMGTCLTACTSERINHAIDDALVAANQFFITGCFGIYECKLQTKDEQNNTILQLQKAIDSKEPAGIKKTLELIESLSANNAFDIRYALRVYNLVMSFLYRLDSVSYEDYIYSYDQLTGMYRNIHEMLGYLRKMLIKQLNFGNENIPDNVTNETFRLILAYVNENYRKAISIQSISQEFIIRPNYVSQLFKKELDTTFTDYLTRLRISFACNLLKTTNLTVNEIAGRAGYDEYYYFARVFKKVTGKIPSEFRNGKNTVQPSN